MNKGPPSILAVVRAVLMRSVLRPPRAAERLRASPRIPLTRQMANICPEVLERDDGRQEARRGGGRVGGREGKGDREREREEHV